MVKCKECGKEFKTEKSLHAHIKQHKMRLAEYYQKNFPRKDLYSGDLIKFKSKEYYFSTDFNDRRNLKKWLESQDEQSQKDYCRRVLQERKDKKNLYYAPSQVELRSVMTPPVQYYLKVFGSYSEICGELGLKNKFNDLKDEIEYADVSSDCMIYIDTTEQKPFKFDIPFEVKTLKFGDYALNDKEISGNCYVERKSLNDFIGTMSGGFDRFKREIERAREDDAKLIVVVEENLNNCLNFKFLPYVSKKIKATPEFIFHNVRELLQTYDNLHFLFVKGRPEATRVIQKLFLNASAYNRVDLQLAYDIKKL